MTVAEIGLSKTKRTKRESLEIGHFEEKKPVAEFE